MLDIPDANLKILGKGMQGAYMELMSKKKSMNPFDFMQNIAHKVDFNYKTRELQHHTRCNTQG